MELDFFTGYHGSGKTYTANELLKEGFSAKMVDGGPVIRKAFAESGMKNFDEWVKQREQESGIKWDDILLLESMKAVISQAEEAHKHLFIVGNRSIETIDFLKDNLSDNEVDKILFFECPFTVMKHGYEMRTGKTLTDNEFLTILLGDEKMGLLGVKARVLANPKTDTVIKSSQYDRSSIELAKRSILKKED
jgi:adenylate kinase family enzyme